MKEALELHDYLFLSQIVWICAFRMTHDSVVRPRERSKSHWDYGLLCRVQHYCDFILLFL